MRMYNGYCKHLNEETTITNSYKTWEQNIVHTSVKSESNMIQMAAIHDKTHEKRDTLKGARWKPTMPAQEWRGTRGRLHVDPDTSL